MNGVRHIASAATRRDAIRAVYAAVQAPGWAAPNLDGLADVLRDLSWLPAAPVTLGWPGRGELSPVDERAVLAVLRRSAAETEQSARPVRLVLPGRARTAT